MAPEGDRAIEGQKSQPTGAKASEGKPEGKPAVGPKRLPFVVVARGAAIGEKLLKVNPLAEQTCFVLP